MLMALFLQKSTGARAHLRAVEAPCAVSEDEVACTLRGGGDCGYCCSMMMGVLRQQHSKRKVFAARLSGEYAARWCCAGG